jgi:hypothetical protein
MYNLPLLTTAAAANNSLNTAVYFKNSIIEASAGRLDSYDVTDSLNIKNLATISNTHPVIGTNGDCLFYCNTNTSLIGVYDKNLNVIAAPISYPYSFPSIASRNNKKRVAFTNHAAGTGIYIYDNNLGLTTLTSIFASDVLEMMVDGDYLYYARNQNQFVVSDMIGNNSLITTQTIGVVTCFESRNNLLFVGGALPSNYSAIEVYDVSMPLSPVYLYTIDLSSAFSTAAFMTNIAFDSTGYLLTCSTSGNSSHIAVIDFINSTVALVSVDGSGIGGTSVLNIFIGKYVVCCNAVLFYILDGGAIYNYNQHFIDLANNDTIKNTIRLNSVVNHTRPISLLGKYKS